MLRKLRNEEEGFTLIELLVVILIIGILAAIALPSFLGQRNKGWDASAKSNARNMVSQLESCYVDGETYKGGGAGGTCLDAVSGGGTVASLPYGAAQGDVEVTAVDVSTYTINAHSKSGKDFIITKDATGA